jgi:hypothetical protein
VILIRLCLNRSFQELWVIPHPEAIVMPLHAFLIEHTAPAVFLSDLACVGMTPMKVQIDTGD